MIISHRGNGPNAIPNSIPSFESALRAGADGFECDLRLTADEHIVIHHNGNMDVGGRRITVRSSTMRQLDGSRLLTLEGLIDYIAQVRVPAFLEVKNLSPYVVKRIVAETDRADLWQFVHVVGFPIVINNAIRIQQSYPKLQVLPIAVFPASSLVRTTHRGSGILFGWQDSIPASERLFRTVLSPSRLAQLRRKFEQQDKRLIAGVINRPDGFNYFAGAGITDFVTDDVPAAVAWQTLRTTEANSGHELARTR